MKLDCVTIPPVIGIAFPVLRAPLLRGPGVRRNNLGRPVVSLPRNAANLQRTEQSPCAVAPFRR